MGLQAEPTAANATFGGFSLTIQLKYLYSLSCLVEDQSCTLRLELALITIQSQQDMASVDYLFTIITVYQDK